MCPSGGCPIPLLQELVPVVGVILVLDSLVCFLGLRSAFMLGGVCSAAMSSITLYNWAGASGGEVWVALVVLSLLSIVLDLLALRPKSSLREQANPMNLPIFG